METVWRVILYGDFMVKLVWRLSGVFMEKHGKSNYQSG